MAIPSFRKRIRGWVFSSISNKPERFARIRDTIQAGLAGGHLQPVIARIFKLDQIAAAHAYMESNQQIGKVVVTI